MSTHLDLEGIFPNLRHSGYRITSGRTPKYNCISWAAGEDGRLWWPFGGYWPHSVPRDETLDSFILAFRTLGYEPCDDTRLEGGYEKVAIYADSTRTPTHMARQLDSGHWTSKLGQLEDIKHYTLQGLEGEGYGQVIQVLKRRRKLPKPGTRSLWRALSRIWRRATSRHSRTESSRGSAESV